MKRRQEFEQKLIEKAMKDEAFKKQLIENPKESLKNEFGMNFPESLEIKIIEEEARKIYFVLPYVPDTVSAEQLSDMELEKVAGGAGQMRDEYTYHNICVW
jgi:hypothetical protein